MSNEKRIVCWFSCGAASAVATKLAITENNKGERLPLIIAYTEIREEHPDNKRFLSECQEWFGQEVIVLKDSKYNTSIYDVFKKVRYLKGPKGAACTRLLKKAVRKDFEKPTDRQVFGYTADAREIKRVDKFIDANNDVDLWTPLIDRGIAHSDCLAIIEKAGIELPEMYKLGYKNNNCIGCVKGEAGYWNKIRVDFPEVFERMARMEEYLGRTVCKIEKRVNGITVRTRPTLRELPPDAGDYESEADISWGICCLSADNEINQL